MALPRPLRKEIIPAIKEIDVRYMHRAGEKRQKKSVNPANEEENHEKSICNNAGMPDGSSCVLR